MITRWSQNLCAKYQICLPERAVFTSAQRQICRDFTTILTPKIDPNGLECVMKTLCLFVGLMLCSSVVLADNVEGKISAINSKAKTLVVQGKTFYVTPDTNFDDNLGSFKGLKVGQRVDVDYDRKNGKRYAAEIEDKSDQSSDDQRQSSQDDDRDQEDDRQKDDQDD
jgi:hypothetical protein